MQPLKLRSESRLERIQEAIKRVPRELFVPEVLKEHAYSDKALPIGFQQTITQTQMVQRMTEEVTAFGGTRFLEIGTGTGYQTAVLALVVPSVFSIERIAALVPSAKKRIEALGIHNTSIRVGNGMWGWNEYAPYDGILVTACMTQVPTRLLDQLSPHGVLVGPLKKSDDSQAIYSYKKVNGEILKRCICSCAFVPIVD